MTASAPLLMGAFFWPMGRAMALRVAPIRGNSGRLGWRRIHGRRMMSELATTRRDFLMMAGMGAAGATLVRPSELFAAQVKTGGVVKPTQILVAADAHPAIHSAAKILAKKLGMERAAIRRTTARPRRQQGSDCAGAGEGRQADSGGDAEGDGYTVTYTGGIGGVGRAAAQSAVCGGRAAPLG
jgi:hypothetical protein